MITIRLDHDLKKLARDIDARYAKQIPYAAALALTRTAQDAQRAVISEMSRVFDRPTPYTLNSVRIRSANKSNLEAIVWLKDDAGKGTPATKYLLPQIVGGQRGMKRFEKALQARGLMPSGWRAVPGQAAKLDSYGNMSRGQIVQILSALKAAEQTAGYAMNRTQRSARRRKNLPQFFSLTKRSGKLLPGVYERIKFAWGSAVKPVLIYVPNASYSVRLPFSKLVDDTAKKRFETNFNEAIASAIAKAR